VLSGRFFSSLLEKALRAIRFAPYAPVRRQVLNIHRGVNRARKTAGLALVPVAALRLRRPVVRVFDAVSSLD
jgi:hypothetical protein